MLKGENCCNLILWISLTWSKSKEESFGSLYNIFISATEEGWAVQGVALASGGVEEDVELSAGRCLQLTDVGYPPDTLSCSTSNLLSCDRCFLPPFICFVWTVFDFNP